MGGNLTGLVLLERRLIDGGMMGYSVLVSTCTALQSIAIAEATSETWIWPGTVKREHWSGMYINWI